MILTWVLGYYMGGSTCCHVRKSIKTSVLFFSEKGGRFSRYDIPNGGKKPRVTSALLAVVVASFLAFSGSLAFADIPANRLASAPLVSPGNAWSFYGGATSHTNGAAAVASTPPGDPRRRARWAPAG